MYICMEFGSMSNKETNVPKKKPPKGAPKN